MIRGYAGTGRFFVAESGKDIIGHLAFIPQEYEQQGVIRCALAADAMTHPRFRRQAVFSRLTAFCAERLRDDFQVVIAFQIRRSVLPGMMAGGWRPAVRVPLLFKPLSLRSMAHDLGIRLPGREPRAVRNSAASIRPIGEGDFDRVDGLLQTTATRQKRNRHFLAWRYRANPHWQYDIDGLFEEDHLRAFVVTRQVVLRGMTAMAIVDAGGGDPALQQLLRFVSDRGRQRRAGLATALLSKTHPAYGPLRRCGFFPGPYRFRLLLQVLDESVREAATTPWSLSWGDTDHL